MKKYVGALICVIFAITIIFTGCTGGDNASSDDANENNASVSDESNDSGSEDELYIAVIAKSFQHQYWQAVKQGTEKAAEELGVKVTFEGPETESMVDKQVEMIQAAIGRNPDAICVAALDIESLGSVFEEAEAKGIKVIGFDAGIQSDHYIVECSTDNNFGGATAAEHMAEAIGGSGKVSIVSGAQAAANQKSRYEGFVNKLAEEYPDIEVVDRQYCEGDSLKATDIAKAMITANPDLKGIYAPQEASVEGTINAVTELEKIGDITIIGYDSGKFQLEAVRNGVELGAIAQDPINCGYLAVESAVKAINGETQPKYKDTGFKWYDKSNVDSEEIVPLLYE